ncbi:cytochrome P450 [Thamnocephalis sphaerospora]|uniref:Cytochrome P450 n=1 Tax=Thamnocephalis sphaerospora TaxID=78915 RepID=A0A4P9XRI5_9FUNG|nr:cytochrome P450 [Thamnocephalis sphaerospora]|eukprot:RKP08696.1 cytochrome P450 [Thamnocephalis sphaerospora]
MLSVGGVLLAILAGVLLRKFAIQEYLTPLAKLPGLRPSWLSNWIFYYDMLFRPHISLPAEQHQQHGPIVRMGQRVVSIGCPDMFRTVYASYRFPKSEEYSAFRVVGVTLFSTQDTEDHRRRKKLIAPAYSQVAISDLEPLIHKTGTANLLELLHKHADANEPVDMMHALRLMTFDVIGEIAFGRSFDMLTTGNNHPITKWIEDHIRLSIVKYMLGPVFMLLMPKEKLDSRAKFAKFAEEAVRKRREQPNTNRKDTLQRLLEAVDEETGDRLSESELVGEAIGQIVAGTETTASAIMALHLLYQSPERVEHLRAEVTAAAPDLSAPITHAAVRNLPYLDAVISESQRLRPVSAYGAPRVVPKGGVNLGGYFIPEKTVIKTCFKAIHTNESVFSDAMTFNPERWMIDESKLAAMRSSLIPFHIGPRACIGRALAMMEMRLTIAEVVRRFALDTPPHLMTDMTPMYRTTCLPVGKKWLVLPRCIE